MSDRVAPRFKVFLSDWLAIYRLADGHSTIRVTELWAEWGLVGTDREPHSRAYVARRRRDVLRTAIRLGPAQHDPGWCDLCNPNGDL